MARGALGGMGAGHKAYIYLRTLEFVFPFSTLGEVEMDSGLFHQNRPYPMCAPPVASFSVKDSNGSDLIKVSKPYPNSVKQGFLTFVFIDVCVFLQNRALSIDFGQTASAKMSVLIVG